MAKQPTWIDEHEAADLIGLPVKTLIRYATAGEVEVRITRATRKARPRFAKEDIEVLLNQNIKKG